MSVDFARRYTAEMRGYGMVIHEHPGWERNGNGQSSAYLGGSLHHTGAAFDGGLDILIHGRPDLPGPLCNVAGHANGTGRLIAAHPANHAGAGNGRSMGPLPRTRTFNRLVWGLEIMYPGSVPMTREQYRFALIHAGVVSKILGRPNPEWVRAHAETSETGKWDPGFAPGRTIDMGRFRGDVLPAMIAAQEDDLPTPAELWGHHIDDPYPGAGTQPAAALVGWAATHAAKAREVAEHNTRRLEETVKAILDRWGQEDARYADLVERLDRIEAGHGGASPNP